MVEFSGGGGSAIDVALRSHEGSLNGLETGDDLGGEGTIQAREGEARGKVGYGEVGGSVGDELQEVRVRDGTVADVAGDGDGSTLRFGVGITGDHGSEIDLRRKLVPERWTI